METLNKKDLKKVQGGFKNGGLFSSLDELNKLNKSKLQNGDIATVEVGEDLKYHVRHYTYNGNSGEGNYRAEARAEELI